MKKTILLVLCFIILFLSSCVTTELPNPGDDPTPAMSPSPEPSPQASTPLDMNLPITEPPEDRPKHVDIARLLFLTDMTELYINGSAEPWFIGADWEPLKYFSDLTSLSLEALGISDVSMLMGLTNLQTLCLIDNPIDSDQLNALAVALPDCEIIVSLPPPFTDQNGFIWAVAPQYDYEVVFYCWCGRYTARGFNHYLLSPLTGRNMRETDDSHGFSETTWIYDQVQDLFGYHVYGDGGTAFYLYPRADFASQVPESTHRFQPVRLVDSTRIFEMEDVLNGGMAYEISEALLGDKYALAYGGTLISDFIYDKEDIDQWLIHEGIYSNRDSEYIAVRRDGKWGMLDKDGQISVPFIFDHIVGIDEYTAFAKTDGLYGIIKIPVL